MVCSEHSRTYDIDCGLGHNESLFDTRDSLRAYMADTLVGTGVSVSVFQGSEMVMESASLAQLDDLLQEQDPKQIQSA